MRKICLGIIALMLLYFGGHAQNDRFAVIGSSTAAGTGVPAVSSWPNRVKAYYIGLGIVDTLYNIAQSATSCYTGMPTGYVPPPGRPAPDPNLNITKALSFNPKPTVVIVNYPSNGYDTWSYEEILSCLQTIKNYANAQNVDCYITTSQPRDDFPFAARQRLLVVRDSILNRFGDKAIDFWTPIGNTTTLGILSQVALGDAIHINADGHGLLANKVFEKDIFSLQAPLPVRFEAFTARKSGTGIHLEWRASAETRNSYYTVQKSHNGRDFNDLVQIPVNTNGATTNSYQFTDLNPAPGGNYFRIRHTESDGSYNLSRTTKVQWNEIELSMGSVYPNPASQSLYFNTEANKDLWVEVYITDINGKDLHHERRFVGKGSNIHSIQLPEGGSGVYILRLRSPFLTLSRPFVKGKE